MTSWHPSQKNAIHTTTSNNFSNGVHAHATGTGKSWIALQILLEFSIRNPQSHVLWICEQKSILNEQFDASTVKRKGFSTIREKFIIMDFSKRKCSEWTEEIQMATIWKKPILIIINRAFLVSGLKYTQLKAAVGLIIHDECHSIVNATTRAFYSFALTKWPSIHCIGFSATPVLDYPPFTQLLTQYSIYNAVVDKVILPPKIHWLKCDHHINYDDILVIIRKQLEYLPYKKILVWCGMIKFCEELANKWSGSLKADGISIAIDTSTHQSGVEEFMAAEERALMFCAAKHREGSDIKNLDCCIFMDNVEDRDPKVFVQCVGRTLRRDLHQKKQYGLIIDISALSSIKICDRINKFMGTSSKTSFPFSYNCDTLAVNGKSIKLHGLTMQSTVTEKAPILKTVAPSIKTFFIRDLPATADYQKRLEYEITLITKKDLIQYLMQALEILKITEGIPHVTRGSCGSSLLCYVLGISHVDPVKYNISFARFLTDYRSTLPDIDFDFPYNLRDEVFLQLELRWPGAIARISNHVFFHKKSALREAIRRIGIRRQIKSVDLHGVLRSLKASQKKTIDTTVKSLENTFRTYSLHCGGVVFYPDGVPEELLLKSKKGSTIAQITLNKHDVSNNKTFKIDILSSRALAQIYEVRDLNWCFESWTADEKIAQLFCTGDNIGLTLAESPLCRKAFLKFKPCDIDGLAMCLAIIRPAARAARHATTMKDLDTYCVYDDDAINFISMAFQCDDEKADYYRRGLTKGDPKIKAEFDADLQKIRPDARNILLKAIKNMRAYSFCKSHAYSYAQLIWKLAWMKIYRPKEFWKSALKHCQSSYRKWVHLYEAYLAGVDLYSGEMYKKKSIYGLARQQAASAPTTPEESLRRLGYWDFSKGFIPDCYHFDRKRDATFRGIIASSRYLSYDKEEKKAVVFLCVGPKKYIEVIVTGRRLQLKGKIGIDGVGTKLEDDLYECSEGKFVIF